MNGASVIDEALRRNREKSFLPEELEGFGPAKRKPPRIVPVVKVLTPSREDGPKGYGLFIGMKGTF